MIPVLLFGAAALYTVAIHSAINDLKEEIEEIQDESQQMIDETRELIDVTNENLKGACSKAFEQRENIYKTTLKKATEITNKIKIKEENVVLCNERQEVVDKISSIKESTFAKSPNLIAGTAIGAVGAYLGAAAGGVIVSTIVGVKMTIKVDEAKEERARIRCECEDAKTQCTKVRYTTNTINNSIEVIYRLNQMLEYSLINAEKILNEKGENINNWTIDERNSIRSMFNLTSAVSEILSTQMLTKGGNISTKYKQIINETSKKLDIE